MIKIPARVRKSILTFLLLVSLFIFSSSSATYAQTPTPTPAGSPGLGGGTIGTNWVFDPLVTEVGKNADRARQLLWWIWSHPSVYSAPVFAELWGFSRNIVYVFVILVIVAFGLGLILSKRQGAIGPIFSGVSPPFFGLSLPSVFFKVAVILLYVTFSYILVLGLIQTAEVMMKFFIEFIGGRDLFNIFFAGGGNSEANYIGFVGYRDTNVLNLEMVNTSLFIIRFTSLTYNVMSIILILRAIILWFLLIVSPFLALLMPFIFIRNTGWIWIGVFFQWLFYGPLVALFISALARIWKAGIPYPFDFSHVNQSTGQIYPTSINILYGGPAQTLTPTNSANYVDTYAEYTIALVMLWAAVILPWLLLRIFRDYCCEVIAASYNVLQSIYDRMRQYPPPTPSGPSAAPTTTTGQAAQLPFRGKVEERIKKVSEIQIEKLKEISTLHTDEIAKAMDLSVSRLADVSRYETNEVRRMEVEKQLNRIAQPERVMTTREREQYSTIRSEIKARAEAGDRVAVRMMTAADRTTAALIRQPAVFGISRVADISRQTNISEENVRKVLAAVPATIAYPMASTISKVAKQTNLSETKVKQILSTAAETAAVAPSVVVSLTTPAVAKEVGIPEGKVKEVLTAIPKSTTAPTAQAVSSVAKKTGLSEDQVKKIITTSRPAAAPGMPATVVPVSVDDYEEVKSMWLKHYRDAPVPVSETIKDRISWLTKDEKNLTNVIDLLSSSDVKMKQKGLEQVANILPFLLLGGFSESETLLYLKAKLSAVKQVQQEVVTEKEVKERVKEEFEKEEELVEVKEGKKEEKKVMEEKRVREMEMPIRGKEEEEKGLEMETQKEGNKEDDTVEIDMPKKEEEKKGEEKELT